jgi:hypothetical protein
MRRIRTCSKRSKPATPEASGSQADSYDVQHRFGHTVYSQVFLDQRVLERGGTERRQSDPGCRQAKSLTEVTGIQQDDSIRARKSADAGTTASSRV